MPVTCEYTIAYVIAYFAKTCISHIFFAYNGIFKIAYMKIMQHMLHMQKFAYIRVPHNISAYAIAFFYHSPCPMLF